MPFINNLKFAVFGLSIISLAGCLGSNETKCNSTVTLERIKTDIYNEFEANLNPDALSFVSNIRFSDIVTLAQDKEIGVRECELLVVINTTAKNNEVNVPVVYTNQAVENGDEKSRTVYSQNNSLFHVRYAFFQAVAPDYQQKQAEKNGFQTYEDLIVFNDAKTRLAGHQEALQKIAIVRRQVNEELESLKAIVDADDDAFANGFSILLNNRYVEMAPVKLDVKVEYEGLRKTPKYSVALNIKNISTYTIERIHMNAGIITTQSNNRGNARLHADVTFPTPLPPGEKRKVVVVLKEKNETGFNSFSSRTNTFMNIEWDEVKDVKIRFDPVNIDTEYGLRALGKPYRVYYSVEEYGLMEGIAHNAYDGARLSLSAFARAERRVILDIEHEEDLMKRLLGKSDTAAPVE